MVLDHWVKECAVSYKRHKAQSHVVQVSDLATGKRLLLAKPVTFMNKSGSAVAGLVNFYSLNPKEVIVIHDDLDIPFGAIRLKMGGGHGGHNGLRDIIAALKTPEFFRIRLGIGKPSSEHADTAGYVLSPFFMHERKELPFLCDKAKNATELLLRDGLLVAQNAVHGVKKDR